MRKVQRTYKNMIDRNDSHLANISEASAEGRLSATAIHLPGKFRDLPLIFETLSPEEMQGQVEYL